MPTPTNPFSKVLDTLWALLEADSNFTALVPIGNRVKYNLPTNNDPLKDVIATADLPEVAIIQDGLTSNLFNSSSSSRFDASYKIVLNTGDFRYQVLADQLNWLIVTNIIQWKTTLAAITWKGSTFIKRANLSSLVIGESDWQRNRNIRGWVVVWKLDLEMHFPTVDLTFGE